MDVRKLRDTTGKNGQFEGKFLVAMPDMDSDEFAGSVIYVCAHSEEGAMGFQVNRTSSITLAELINQTDIGDQREIELAQSVYDANPVHHGGPVDSHRGFVLHSDDYYTDSTIPITPTIYLTSTMSILKSIAHGSGPRRMAVALGYSGWGPGQLEDEIARNGWLTADATPEIVFGARMEGKWAAALATLGVSPLTLSSEAGRA